MGIEDILRLLRRLHGIRKIWEGGVLGVTTCGFGQHLFDLTITSYGNGMWYLSKHYERFSANATSLHTSLPNIINALKRFPAIMCIRLRCTHLPSTTLHVGIEAPGT